MVVLVFLISNYMSKLTGMAHKDEEGKVGTTLKIFIIVLKSNCLILF